MENRGKFKNSSVSVKPMAGQAPLLTVKLFRICALFTKLHILTVDHGPVLEFPNHRAPIILRTWPALWPWPARLLFLQPHFLPPRRPNSPKLSNQHVGRKLRPSISITRPDRAMASHECCLRDGFKIKCAKLHHEHKQIGEVGSPSDRLALHSTSAG